MDFTALHFSGHTHPLVIGAIRFCGGVAEENFYAPFSKPTGFPAAWDKLLIWHSGKPYQWATFDMRTCTRLGGFFRNNNLAVPNMQFLICADVLKAEGIVSDGYENVAVALGIAPPDINDVLSKAQFTGTLLNRFDDRTLQMFIIPADFSEPEERKTNVKTEGVDLSVLAKTPVADLLKRPRERRFAGTYVAFTGQLYKNGKKYNRKEAAQEVENHGGNVNRDGIDKNVTHLISGEQREGNVGKAGKGYDVVVISADVFFRLIGQ